MCTLSHIFACISPITKNVGAILIQNEDLNAIQITYYRYHTLSDNVFQNGIITIIVYRIEWFIDHRACRCNTDNNDT